MWTDKYGNRRHEDEEYDAPNNFERKLPTTPADRGQRAETPRKEEA
jgi:hypothetical protein